jgi:hypothetical protein
VNASRRAWSWPIVAGWAGWPSATILLATVARSWWSQPIERSGYRSLRGGSLGPLHDADAARTRVITLVTAQLMEYFQEVRQQPQPAAWDLARQPAEGVTVDRLPRSSRVRNLPFDLLRHGELLTMRARSRTS